MAVFAVRISSEHESVLSLFIACFNLVEKDGGYFLDTNIYDVLEGFEVDLISTDTLGEAFEPSQKFENPDGTPITFDCDYSGNRRGLSIIPGPFVSADTAKEQLY